MAKKDLTTMEENRLSFLKETYNDCRAEIQMRISQRDAFALQYIVSSGAVLSLGMLDFSQSPYLFFLLPFITLFFTVQILYSYSIHDRVHKFLCEFLEPEIAKILNYPKSQTHKLFWESFCETDTVKNRIKTPGIRKGFFVKMSYIAPILAASLFILLGIEKQLYSNLFLYFIVGFGAMGLSLFVTMFVLKGFKKKENEKTLSGFAQVDYINKAIRLTKTNKAIFIDRDGTLHKDKVNTFKIEDLEYFDDTFSAVKKLYDLGYNIVVVTNQDGIAKGLYTKEDMSKFNAQIIKDFKDNGIEITAIYYSPYKKEDKHISFKPNSGMMIRACWELDIDLFNSYLIGDQISDIIAGNLVGINSIMVTTGIYRNNNYANADYLFVKPTTVSNLTQAVEIIFAEMNNN